MYLTLSWRTYPISEVSKPECKKYTRAEMWDDCKMPLPKIDINDLKTYAKDQNNLFVYSDLWWSSYSDGWNTSVGSSPWIDIATSNGTPVYSIWDWEVIISKLWWEFGNTITIRHIHKGWYIYSSYSHLNDRDVKVWDTVTEWQLIGKVWRTGYVRWQYGNHLDFQITTKTSKTSFYPYSFNDCKMWEYHEMIEGGYCRDKIFEYTADPVVFLNTNGEVLYNDPSTYSQTSNEYKQAHAAASEISKTNIVDDKTNKIKNIILGKNTQIQNDISNKNIKTDNQKLAINNIKKNDTAKLWKVYKFTIQTNKKQMETIKVNEEDWLLKIGKNTNKEKTTADVYIKAIKKWNTTIKIMDGKKLIASYSLKIT